jgi:hypothetical protein
MGGEIHPSPASILPVLAHPSSIHTYIYPSIHPKTVISTDATDSIIFHRGAEKTASLPKSFTRLKAVACSLIPSN